MNLHRPLPSVAVLLATAFIAVPAARATTVVATVNQFAPTSTTSYTPTYVISATNNVLAGLAPSASSGNFTLENSGGLTVLTDGVFGAMTNDGSASATHPALATFGGGASTGTTITYTLTAATQLSSIVIYSGWNDNGRDQANYTVQGSTDGGANYFTIGTVNYNPTVTASRQSASQVTFTDDSGNLSANAVFTNIRINANTGTENGYAGLAEITAYSAVPESGSAVLGALGLLAVLRRRRA